MYLRAGQIPFWMLRTGPALATIMTTLRVYLQRRSRPAATPSSTCGSGLYVFYFPLSRIDAALNVLWAAA